MKYIKKIESFVDYRISAGPYLTSNDSLFIHNVMEYLKVNTLPLDEDYKLESPYDINILDFFKEIFLNKTVIFRPLKKRNIINDKVKDVEYFPYKDDVYIKLKIADDWYLINNHELIFIKNYDATSKPLHKEVKLKKEAEKYNL